MSRRSRFSPELKIEIVSKVLDGKCSVPQAARAIGADKSSVKRWIAAYRVRGVEFAIEHERNAHYPLSLKIAAVNDHLLGYGSLQDICFKYDIRSESQLRAWLKAYNDGTLKETRAKGASRMKKGRATTQEERVEIVKFCLEHGCNYGLTIDKFGVSYDQIYAWVRKYRERGVDGLSDRRGKRKSLDEMTEVERLRAELKLKEAEVKRLYVENLILKKVRELQRGRELEHLEHVNKISSK